MPASIAETGGCAKGECFLDPAESKNPSERGSFMDENREIPGSSGRIAPGPAGKGKSVMPARTRLGSQTVPIVPMKRANEDDKLEELVEGRGATEGRSSRSTASGHSTGLTTVQRIPATRSNLARVALLRLDPRRADGLSLDPR